MSDIEYADDTVFAQIEALEDRRIRALVDGDVGALAQMFDESLVHIHAPGLTQNRAQLLEHVATRRAYLSIVRGELTIRLVGDVAIITGPIINRLQNPDGGERTMEGVVTQVVARNTDGEWRFLSFQLTPLTQQVWSALPSEEEKERRHQ